MKALLFVALFVLSVYSQTPPMISEVFSATTAINLETFGFNFNGTGTWAANQPAGESVEVMDFGNPNHPFNQWVLSRYDLHRGYEIIDQFNCRSFPLDGSLPAYWDWVKLAKYSRTSFNGRLYDTWTLNIGYAVIAIGVTGNTPIFFTSFGETRNITIQFMTWSPMVSNSSVFNVPSQCNRQEPIFEPLLNNIENTQDVGCESRTSMISRAQVWVNNHVPYNQAGDYQGYREDCSGYVSMAWQTSKPGYTTFTLPQISHPIAKSELQPGDILLCTSEHVVLFGGWTDSGKTHYTAFEETKPGEGTVKRETPYPYWYNTGCFHPYRYDHVC